MKEKQPFVIFKIVREGKQEDAKVYTQDLRQILKEAKLNKSVTDVELKLEYNNQAIKIPMKVSEIRKLIKQSEIAFKPIVPRKLEMYLADLTEELVHSPILPIVGREDEIEKVWFYLSQKKRNNVFLVGPTDVGKTTIAYEIARQISTNECPKEFYDRRVIMFKPERILKIKSNFAYEQMIGNIMKFLVKNRKNLIIYVDKAIYMKTDGLLITMLYNCLMKYHIPFLTTSKEEQFDNYFLGDSSLCKYVNEVYVEEPELEEVKPMIQNHILRLQKKYHIKISDEMMKFGIFTSKLSNSVSVNPGNAINIFEKAFLEAKRKEKHSVDKQSILSCYDSYLKLYNHMAEVEKKSIAYHEVGHYVVCMMCQHIKDRKIAFVSILPMMDFLGVNWSYSVLGKTLNYTKDYFLDQIGICMGGRIAEKLVTGKDSTGASADLAIANSIAENMLTVYGFAESQENKNRSYVTVDEHIKQYLISEKRKKEFDKEIQKSIDEGYQRAEEIIKQNVGLIEAIVTQLLKEEILTGEQLSQICEEYNKTK